LDCSLELQQEQKEEKQQSQFDFEFDWENSVPLSSSSHASVKKTQSNESEEDVYREERSELETEILNNVQMLKDHAQKLQVSLEHDEETIGAAEAMNDQNIHKIRLLGSGIKQTTLGSVWGFCSQVFLYVSVIVSFMFMFLFMKIFPKPKST